MENGSQDKAHSPETATAIEQRDVAEAAHALTLTDAVDRAVTEWKAERHLAGPDFVHFWVKPADLDKLASEIALKLTMAGFGRR